MKFVLFCDVLRAPGDNTKPTIGVRFSGAAVRKSPGETDAAFDIALKDLFTDVANRPLPKPGDSGFDDYLMALAKDAGSGKGAGPLFPWIGGELGFSFLWAAAEPGKIPTKIDPAGVTAAPITVPAGFELTDTSFRFLLYTAISDLIADRTSRTNRFMTLEPFKLVGWDDTTGRQRIDEIADTARSNFRYEAFMAGLASLPAPVPHGRLNLVRFAQLTAIKPTTAPEVPFLVAAPRFKPLGATAYLEPKFGTVFDPAPWNVINPNLVATFPYDSQFGGHDIEVICRALSLQEDLTSSGSFLQRESLWVTRRHDATSTDNRDGVGFEDWLARLPELVADVFDLPRLLLQAMEDDAKAPGAPLTVVLAGTDRLNGAARVAEATLMALRDVVGPGCVGLKAAEALKGPNGSPAHAAIIGRVNDAITELRFGVQFTPAECDELAANVVKYDNDFRDGFRNGSGDAQRLEWLDLVARALGPDLDLPATGQALLDELARRVAVDAAAKGAFDPLPVRRIIDAATLPANAATLQTALWRKAGSSSTKFEGWLVAAGDVFGALFDRGLRLVEILRKANIDLPWLSEEGLWRKAANPSSPDVEVLTGNIRDSIAGYLHGTACATDGAPSPLEKTYQDTYGRMGRLPAAARAALRAAIDQVAAAHLGDWFKPPEKEGNDALLRGELAADAHPIALQIDRLVVGAGDAPDFNENLAGFGLLMRRSQPVDAWRCLTATFAEIDPEQKYNGTYTEVTFETAPRSVMGALPVSYTSQMPQAIVMYDNRPIVGDSQADVQIEPQPGEEPDPRIVRLVQPVIQNNPPAETLLPFLAYGATYEVAPFGISNHGAMPETIRRDDYPAILDPAKLKDTLFPSSSEFVRRFSYLRRTGIGSLRVAPFFAPLQREGRLFHPMVAPKGTKPLAEEIFAPSRAVEPWQADGPPRPLKMKTALLLADAAGDPLLSKPENIDCGELKLRIGAPLTPLEDFDRWIAFEEATLSSTDKEKLRAFRKGLRSYHFDQTSDLHDREIALRDALSRNDNAAAETLRTEIEAIKATLDLQDPAVGALAISVTRVRRDGALSPDAVAAHKPELFDWTWQWQPGMDPKTPFANGRLPIELNCRLSKDRSKPLFDKVTKTVWAAPGDVVVVRLFAGVDDGLFVDNVAPSGKRRFDEVVRDSSIGNGDDGAVVTGTGGAKFRLFATHTFALEAASFGLPADVALGATISGSIVGDVPDQSDERTGDIRLDFKRAPSVSMDAIGAVVVGSQAWRWTGRPLSPFPFAKVANLNTFPPQDPQDPGTSEPPSPSEHALLWDVEGFAERLDETLDDELAASPVVEAIDTAAVPPSSKPQAERIALRSPGRADTARYMRFRVTATGRYAPAYAAARETVAPQAAIWRSASGKWATPWYRILRPAKKPDTVPKPGIRAVIPLTRALRADDKTSPVAGVLAVADGAWFEHAGLADWILAGTENAYRKKLAIDNAGNTTIAVAAEMGPDPLVRTYGLGQVDGQTPKNPAELRSAIPLAVSGPLGHGFDTGTATGLYLNSSFFVRAPELAAKDAAAWWMGKLAFRRLVMAEGTRGYWNENVATPFTSVEPQVSATLHSVSATASPASIKFRAAGTLLSGTTVKAEAVVLIEASRADSSWKLDVEDTVTKAKDSFVIGEETFDLRVIAVRRISRVPDGPDQYVWYELLVLVKPQNRAWRLAWQTQWFNDPKLAENKDPADTKLKIDFPIDSQTGVVIGAKRVCTVLQVSEATEGRWAQFMPNTETLSRSSSVSLTDLKLSVDPASNKQLLLSSNGNPFAWLATDALKTGRGKQDQGLFNLLLVTKRVASVSGTDEEAYVGLYHSSAGFNGTAKAVVLTWFDRGTSKPLDDGSELIGRILTIRAGNPTVNAAQIAEWQKDPWKFFFPPETRGERSDATQVFGATRPPDASAQIIEIYAPIAAVVRT